jgi:prephenate dehydrogenase
MRGAYDPVVTSAGAQVNLQLETWKLKPETRQVRWKKVSLIGVGLLGGSLGLALKERRFAGSVTGFVRRRSSIAECRKKGALDEAVLDLREAVEGAELIVLCTPIGRMRELVKEMAPWLRPGAVVTDVGSVKQSVVRDLETLVAKAGAHFIGSHPMAGSEKSGVVAARSDLFVDAFCVVTPTRKSNRTALKEVVALWKGVGARVLKLAPELHDDLVSRSSHLPHLVAAGLANLVLHPAQRKEQAMLCANGFRDTTRIASGSPEMWRDIALANRGKLDRALGRFLTDLGRVRRALKTGNHSALASFFETAKQRRDRWSAQAESHSPE